MGESPQAPTKDSFLKSCIELTAAPADVKYSLVVIDEAHRMYGTAEKSKESLSKYVNGAER